MMLVDSIGIEKKTKESETNALTITENMNPDDIMENLRIWKGK